MQSLSHAAENGYEPLEPQHVSVMKNTYNQISKANGCVTHTEKW